jgi:hypothetical protein
MGNSYARCFVIHRGTARPCAGGSAGRPRSLLMPGSTAPEARTVEAHQDTGLCRTPVDNRARNGHPAAQPKKGKPWETERRQVSPNAVGFGI